MLLICLEILNIKVERQNTIRSHEKVKERNVNENSMCDFLGSRVSFLIGFPLFLVSPKVFYSYLMNDYI